MSANKDSKSRLSAARIVLAITLLAILFFLARYSARTGYAALLIVNSLPTRDLSAAHTAVGLSPGNANNQLLLGALLEASNDRAAAIPHYQTAVQLRPRDYVLWMQLARGQEFNGDTVSAINSGTVAVGLAPFYAQPHWQLGNIMVRAGRTDAGFNELRLAGASDSTLLPAIIDLAWQLSGGNADYVVQTIQPRTPVTYKVLAEYFRKRGEARRAIEMFAAAGSSSREERRAYLGELINAREFQEALVLWSIEHPNDPAGAPMFDQGFEAETDLAEPGFGWRAANPTPTLTLSLDSVNPKEGSSSLRVDFNGESRASAPVISQLRVLVPKTRYQLSVAFRTENVVSGGLPMLQILDPNDNKVLAQTEALPQTTAGWTSVTLDFTTGDSSAIQIGLQRKPCSTEQCPIFGKLWLDGFSLRQV